MWCILDKDKGGYVARDGVTIIPDSEVPKHGDGSLAHRGQSLLLFTEGEAAANGGVSWRRVRPQVTWAEVNRRAHRKA